MKTKYRKEVAALIRELRAVPTVHLTPREKNMAIKSHAKTYAKTLDELRK